MDEQGTVEQILPNGEIMIAVERSSACGNCAMSGLCFTDDTKTIRLQARADFPVKVGQIVRLSLEEGNLLKYSVITYLMPVILLITGAVIGGSIRGGGNSGNPLFSIIGGVTGLLIGLFLVKRYSKRLEDKNKIIIKVSDVRK
jgi:sigma-E factor negative regulatory protein RseC